MVKGKHQQVSSNMWYSNMIIKIIIYIHLHNILQTVANTERCNHSSTFFYLYIFKSWCCCITNLILEKRCHSAAVFRICFLHCPQMRKLLTLGALHYGIQWSHTGWAAVQRGGFLYFGYLRAQNMQPVWIKTLNKPQICSIF